jgi:hypothetical protein
MNRVTDPDLLRMLEASDGPAPVTDPDILRQLNGGTSILPFSRGPNGVAFDSNAGILGTIKRALTLPGDVASGQAQLPSSGAVPGSVPFGDPNSAGERVADLAGLISPVNPAVRAGDRAIAGAMRGQRTVKPQVPTTKELMDEGVKDFDRFRDSGLEIRPEAWSRFGQEAQQNLYNKSVHPVDAANTYTKLRDLDHVPPEAVGTTAQNIKSMRESLGVTAQNFNPNSARDQRAASIAIENLDEFVRGLGPKDTLAGSPARSAQIYERARGNAAAGYRSNEITGELDKAVTGIIERAEGRAQAANSGRNLDNTIRSKVESFLEKPKDVSSLNDEEIAALIEVRKGGKVRNLARYIANLYGGGGGLGQHVSMGTGGVLGAIAGSPGGPAGAGLGAAVGGLAGATAHAGVGSGAKALANKLAKRSLSKADELIRKRSPLYQERLANPQTVQTLLANMPEAKAALARALLLSRER